MKKYFRLSSFSNTGHFMKCFSISKICVPNAEELGLRIASLTHTQKTFFLFLFFIYFLLGNFFLVYMKLLVLIFAWGAGVFTAC